MEEDLGQARIVYDDPDEGTVERDVQNEHIAYFQDHWILKVDEDDDGKDIVRRIPLQRVHYVERSVNEFEEEVSTLKTQVESFAEDVRSKLFGQRQSEEPESATRIDVESGDERSDETEK